jgi:hypothetical protein
MKSDLNIRGVMFEVEYNYQEEYPIMWKPDSSGYASHPVTFEITEINHKGVDFMEFFSHEIDDIEYMLWMNLNE